MKPEVIFSDKDLFVINKPPFWHCLEGKSESQAILSRWIKEHFPDQNQISEMGLCHRLDFQTSGCILIAKSEPIYKRFRAEFSSPHAHDLKKIYWAIVEGSPKQESFEFYFQSRYKSSKKMSVEDSGNENELGRCRFRALKTSETDLRLDSSLSLLEVELLGPGKRHQIRAGLAHLGHPILGDKLYRGKDWENFFGLHSRKICWNENEIEAPSFWPKKISPAQSTRPTLL